MGMNQSKDTQLLNGYGKHGETTSLKQSTADNHHSHKCKCTKQKSGGVVEACDSSLHVIRTHFKNYSLESLKQDYLKLVAIENDEAQVRQIKKDIERTHPLLKFFTKGGEGQEQLERLLQCVAKYDPVIGYVQGMNYMLAGLLYHSEEYVAFWNFVAAYENLELRDIFLPSLPGLSKHNQLLQLLLMSHEHDIFSHFVQQRVVFEIFFTPLLFSLFGMAVPVQEYMVFFGNLVEHNWQYAYKVILSYFRSIRVDILQKEGPELLMMLTQANQQMQSETQSDYFRKWIDVLGSANEIELDVKYIRRMLSNFQQEKQLFRSLHD